MHGERVVDADKGLAREGLASFPIRVGDYVELHSGILGKVTRVNMAHNTFGLAYLWQRGATKEMYQQLTIQSYRRHATVNEITALKLMGLV